MNQCQWNLSHIQGIFITKFAHTSSKKKSMRFIDTELSVFLKGRSKLKNIVVIKMEIPLKRRISLVHEV